jgi:hypothetical protein
MYEEQKTCIQDFYGEARREGGHVKDLGLDGIVILKWIFKKCEGVWTISIWLRIEMDLGSCECDN